MGAVYLQNGVCVLPKADDHVRGLKMQEAAAARLRACEERLEGYAQRVFEVTKTSSEREAISGATPQAAASQRIPAGIWALGFVSLLMDISSEMIHALLPLYLTVGLGSSALVVGFIEGVA